MNKPTATVFADAQHGPGVTVRIGGTQVSVYLAGETGIVTMDDGSQFGLEVTGPWHRVREQVRVLATTAPVLSGNGPKE